MTDSRTEKLAADAIDETAEETRELTYDEALALAVRLQQDEQFEAAEAIYKGLLTALPDFPAAVHFSGVLAHQLGRSDEALERIARSLELAPGVADWHNNLGIVLQECRRLDEAIVSYRRAIELDPEHANAYSNMGVLLRAQGRPSDAEAAYEAALRINPKHVDAWTNLGILLNGLKRTEESVACFCKAITLRPRHPEARRLLALAHCALGEVDKAIEIFEEWLKEEPGHPIALHMLAACKRDQIPARASDGFVAQTFDSFAASFESKLEKLSYRAPALVAAMLEDSGVKPERQLDILDAGCGTGLCGALVAPCARRLVGIDLSAGMLKQAEDKRVYDELFKVELTAYLQDNPGAFDVIVSADTLCYFGALDEVVAAAAAALRPAGLLVFTVERAGTDTPGDYHLETHGRYTHGQPYVERVLRDTGLVPACVAADLRLETGVPVGGLVVRGLKPRSA